MARNAPGNQRTSLKLARARRSVMADYDRMPPALRAWLAEARLQWDPVSARRAWRKALRQSFWREEAAIARMNRLEDARLAEDALRAEQGDG